MDSPRRFTFAFGQEHEPTCRCGRCHTKAELRALVRERRLPDFKWDDRTEYFITVKCQIGEVVSPVEAVVALEGARAAAAVAITYRTKPSAVLVQPSAVRPVQLLV